MPNTILPLYICSGAFTADQYRDVLSELYWPILREKFAGRPFKFQQDNSPVHRSAAVREWLVDEPAFGSAVVYQPPYSPDLNPIEHVWARIKKMLYKKIYRTPTQLSRAVQEAWDQVGQDKEFLLSLTASMPRRLDAVVRAGGGPTEY